MAGSDDAHLLGSNGSSRGFDRCYCSARVAIERCHLAVLNDVPTERVSGAGIAPRDRVVARNAAAALQGRAHDRITDSTDFDRRAKGFDLLWGQPLVVYAIEAIGMDVAPRDLNVMHRV